MWQGCEVRNHERQRTIWLVGVAVVILLVVASNAGVFRGFDATPIDSNQAARRATIGVLAGLALVGATVWLVRRRGSAERIAAAAFGTATIVAFAALLVTALAAGGASTATDPPRVRTPDTSPAPESVESGTVATMPTLEETDIDDSSSIDLGWIFTLLKLVAFGLAVWAALWLWSKRRRRVMRGGPAAPLDPTAVQPVEPELIGIDNDAAADSFAESARALHDADDPRTGIIAAYAALLDGLDAAGAGRRPHEAPEEHLRRSLAQLQVPAEALAEVTRLFLVAKFSSHPMGETDRDQARAMLAVAEQHLRAVHAPAG